MVSKKKERERSSSIMNQLLLNMKNLTANFCCPHSPNLQPFEDCDKTDYRGSIVGICSGEIAIATERSFRLTWTFNLP